MTTTNLFRILALSSTLAVAPALAAAQGAGDWQTDPPPPAQPQDVPAPQYEPPPPQDSQPQYPQQPGYQQQPQSQQPSAEIPPGQWVYTQQYGWIWMPYASTYTEVPASGYGTPYAYVYAPTYGCWAWLAAPWVWGVGAWPYFGVWGPTHYAWYGAGWWRYPSRWHYAPPPNGGGYAGGFPRPRPRGAYGAAPAGAYRGAPAPAGAYRGAPAPYRGTSGAYRGGPAPRMGGSTPFVAHGGGSFPRPAPGGRGGGRAHAQGHGR